MMWEEKNAIRRKVWEICKADKEFIGSFEMVPRKPKPNPPKALKDEVAFYALEGTPNKV